jgi:integrase/recombinase XerD
MEAATTAQLVPPSPPLFDETRLAVSGFLARYSGTTRAGYATDLRAWFSWCAEAKLEIFGVRRAHIELFARWMEEERHLARATIGRRLSTVVGFYRFAVIDGYINKSPAEHVRRPKIGPSRPPSVSTAWSSAPSSPRPPPRGRSITPWPALLGLLGLRVSEACAINIEHLSSERGHPP